MFIHLSIKNPGSPTSVHKYAVRIGHASLNNIEFKGPPDEIEGRYVIPQSGGRRAVIIQAQDAITNMTKRAIGENQKVSGWLMILLSAPNFKPDVLRQPGITYNVSFADVSDKTYKAVYEVR